MCREHVVVRGDDRQIGRVAFAQHRFIDRAAAGKAMGEIGAAEPSPLRCILLRGIDAVEISPATVVTAFGDLGRYGGDGVDDGH